MVEYAKLHGRKVGMILDVRTTVADEKSDHYSASHPVSVSVGLGGAMQIEGILQDESEDSFNLTDLRYDPDSKIISPNAIFSKNAFIKKDKVIMVYDLGAD